MRSRIETLETRRLMAASIEVSALNSLPSISDGDTTPSLDDGTNLGTDFVGGARMLRSFVITNTSAADDLTLANLSVPAGFTIEKGLPDLLGPGSSAPFAISLLHTSQQARSGTLSFTTNVPGSETFDFAISAALAAAPVSGENIFEDVPSFSDNDFVLRGGGSDGNGLPVNSATNRLLRFNVPIGEATIAFTLSGTALDNGEATGDAELLLLRDADADGLLDLAELAAPVTSFIDPAGGAATQKGVPLEAATYFALLRVANFAPVDAGVEQPNAHVDYSLQAAMTAVQPAAIAVTFNGFAVADNDTTPSGDEGTQFGSATVGAAAPQRTFSIKNTGGETLEIGAVSLPGGFELAAPPPATLAGGASASFAVRMLTATSGAKSGTLSFATNAEGANPFNFAIAGTVTPAPIGEITVLLEGGGGTLTDGQTQAAEFGNVTQGQAGPTRTFVVRNDGAAALSLGAVTVPAGFTVTEPLVASLAPGASDAFTVTLGSATVGERAGTLSIASGDADESPFEVPLHGVVVAVQPPGTPTPDISVSIEGTQGTPVEFGSTPQGSNGTTRRVIVRNNGNAPLELGAVTLPGGFAITEALATTLAPGESDGFTVALATTSTGERAGTIRFTSNDPDQSVIEVPVHGVVTATSEPPPIGDGPSTLTVGEVASTVPATVVAGARRAKGTVKFMLSNAGDVPTSDAHFTVFASSDAVVDGADPVLLDMTRRAKVNPGRAKAIRLNVKFTPDAPAGERMLLVRATANGVVADGVGPAVTIEPPVVPLRGSTTPAPLARTLVFGRRARMAPRFRNDGNTAAAKLPATYRLVVSSDGTEAGKVFETTVDGRVSLKPGASRAQRLTTTFEPGDFAPGSYTLIVQLNSELNDLSGQTVALIPFTIA